ncbi:MAG: thiamine pyrophosphate-dependent enzyme, partial [Novosphingobium sp.]
FLPAFREEIVRLLSPHDALLVAGAPVFTYHAEGSGPHWPEGAALGALSVDPQHLSFLPGGLGVLGDVASGLASLAQAVHRRPPPPPFPRKPVPLAAMNASHVCARIAALRPAGSILVEEAPTARTPMHDHLPIVTRGGFYTCASGGLGYGLPAAVGAGLASARKVIALLGDGSAMYTIPALWSAVEQAVDVSFVILNNRRYAALDHFAKVFNMNALPGTEIGGIDFVKLAESMGLKARRAGTPGELDTVLAWSFTNTGPTLVELLID